MWISSQKAISKMDYGIVYANIIQSIHLKIIYD